MKIITEKLNKLDLIGIDNNNYHDLRNLYEAVEPRMTPQDKQELRKLIDVTDNPETISAYLSSKDENLTKTEREFYGNVALQEADVLLSKEDRLNPNKAPDLRSIAKKSYTNEVEAKRIAKLKAKAETIIKNIDNELATLDSSHKPSDELQVYFDYLVPDKGNADTVAGEIVRAMMRLLYRDYNDGDVFYEGYGFETCAAAASFVADKLDLYEDFENIAESGLSDDRYTEALEKITSKVISYLQKHEELLATPNEEDMLDTPTDWLEDYAYGYEFGVDIPENVDYRDFMSFIDEILSNDNEFRNAYIGTSFADFINIEGLSKEGYETLEEYMYKWVDEWVEENYPEEEYEEDEENDYDE